MSPLVTGIVTGILSGGLFGGMGSFLANRSLARKTRAEARSTEARLPAEIDSVIVQGAEQAVLTMKASLESAQGRIAQLMAEQESDRHRIEGLERKVENLQRQVNSANRAVAEAQRRGEEVQHELAAFRQEQERRR